MAQAKLLDQFGVEIEIPTTPIGPPEMRSEGMDYTYRDRFRDYPSRNLTPAKLANILNNADSGDPYEWVLLCEEILEKEPKFKSVLNTRSLAVKGLYWDVEPAELDETASADDQSKAEEIARFCGRAFRTTNCDELIGNLLTALGKPHAVSAITWEVNRDGKRVPRFKIIPATHLRWAFATDEIRLYDPHVGNMTANDFGEPLKPWSTVRALYNPDADHPTRAGLMRTLCWYYLFKIITLKDLIAACERYGMPLRIAKLSDELFKDAEFRELIRSAIKKLGVDGSAVISESTDLEITQAAKASADIYMAVIDYVDKSAAQVVLGHELSSQSSPGSGQLGITAALDVRQDILEGDCHWLSAIIERDVFRPMVGFNFGWQYMHLIPSLYFDFEPPTDLLMAAKVDAQVAATFPSLERSEQQIRDQYGIERPVEGDPDDVLLPGGGASTVQAPPFGTQPLPQPDQQQEAQPTEEPAQVVNARRGPGGRFAKRPRRPARYSKARQRTIDRLAKRGIAKVQPTVTGWASQLRALLKAGVAEGVTIPEMAQRVVKEYPNLDASELEKTLGEQMLLVRLFGRNG